MKLELVSFEQAKSLKELGFVQGNDNCQAYYKLNDRISCVHFNYLTLLVRGGITPDEAYRAPELELAAKWLRDEKNIQLTVRFRGKKWYYDIMSGYEILSIGKDEETYEQALSAGIDKAIEILKSK